ncbi:MAG: ABC transporter ATP-binding protein [Planctomycetota bacterium]
MGAPADIVVTGLSLRSDRTPLLVDFAFSLQHGEHVVLRGPSGCGKTTLLRCLLGFTRPQAGQIMITGRTLDATSAWQLRRQVGYVPQESDLGQGPVSELLAAPFRLRCNADQAETGPARLERLLHELGLAPTIRQRQADELSGGEKQRVAVAIALALDRQILILDEPTSALDAAAKTAMATTLARQRERSVLAATHDPEWIALADRVVELRPPRPSAENTDGRG